MMGSESYIRWEPLTDLPEQPIRNLVAKFDGTHLLVKGPYVFGPSESWLEIQFDYVEAFKFYEEFSDPWMETGLELPRVADGRWTWPLLEVRESRWLARLLHRKGGLDAKHGWKHLTITSLDYSAHVMTQLPPLAVRLLDEEPVWA